MSRDEFLSANPLPDYLRSRGFSLCPAGPNFVSNACPVEEHGKFHRCTTIDTVKNLWHCNDHKQGGTIFDWVAFEEKISIADAQRKLGFNPNGSKPQLGEAFRRAKSEMKGIVKTYDYVDENGALLFQCVRLNPKHFKQRRPDSNGGWIWNIQGVTRVLYRLPEVLKAETVCVAEGEKDADNLREFGFTATTNPMGAGKWRDEFNATLRGKDVLVFGDVGDPDKAGERHTEAVIQSLSGKAKSVRHIELPGGFHDVSDYIASFPSAEQAKKAITNLITTPAPSVVADRPRIARIAPPQNPITIAEWRAVIAKNFPHYARAAEIGASVEAQLLLSDVTNPFALAFVDVPSSGKTITLNFFTEPPELAYTTDDFSPAAFVSHANNVAREKLHEIDLLPKIRYRTLIIPELSPIFGAKEDDLIKSLGVLTRVLDGQGYERDTGVHGHRGYKGDYLFMLLAATTPIQPRVFKAMGNFGSRLFFHLLNTPEPSDDELVEQNCGKELRSKEEACKRVTESFLRTLWSENPNGIDWERRADPRDCMLVISRCARLLAGLRGAVNVYKEMDEDGQKLGHTVPIKELASRINVLFANLARGHALICGRRQISKEDLWPVFELTFDSAPPRRARIIRGLIANGGTLETNQIVDLVSCSVPTALKDMEALRVLGVVSKEEQPGGSNSITLAESFSWFTSDECRELMERRLAYMPEDQPKANYDY
jgi:5S rRNA maturation endonuclease (ribonuclease M5)